MTTFGIGSKPPERTPRLRVDKLRSPGGWHIYAIPVESFPIKAKLRKPFLEAVQAVVDEARRSWNPSTWLLMDNLHKDGAVRELSRHGREWDPEFGLGVWPDREPPRMFKDSDFLDLEFGQSIRESMHSVVYLSGAESAVCEARQMMFGLGCLLITLTSGEGSGLLDAVREPLRRNITDESFRDFPFYFPLIGGAALAAATPIQMDAWLGPVQLYVRESEEDSAILVLSRGCALEALEGGQLEPAGNRKPAPMSI